MRKIHKIEAATLKLPTRKRVAAYARVSLENSRLLNSLSAQVNHYSNLIQNNLEWEYVGAYVDSGISGTTTGRDEFQRLIADCEAGKIDIVLTKSISRFARNTVDLLTTVRRFKEIGVDVCFEREGINSSSAEGEVMLSILASFAQEESRNTSENIKWAIRSGFQKGKQSSTQIYGYSWDGANFILKPDKAEIVRLIFAEYLAGNSPHTIVTKLAEMGAKPMYGKKFYLTTILSMLKNEKYIGTIIMQKTFVANHITKEKKKNNGELPRHIIENAHPAIIDRDTFDRVQERLNARKITVERTVFTGKIHCEVCGLNFQRSTKHYKGNKAKVMGCANRKHGRPCDCDTKEIPEKVLEAVTAEVLGLAEFDENIFHERIRQIVVPSKNILIFHFNNSKTATREWKSTASKDCWTPERRATQAERKKGTTASEATRKAQSEGQKAHYAAHPERRQADRDRMKKYMAENPDWDKEFRKASVANKSEWWTPERRAAQSAKRKAYFARIKAAEEENE